MLFDDSGSHLTQIVFIWIPLREFWPHLDMTRIWNRIFSGDLDLRFCDWTTTTATLVSPLCGKETMAMERQFQLWREQEVTKSLETTVATEETSVDAVMATELAHKQYVLVNWPVKILYWLFSFSQWTFVDFVWICEIFPIACKVHSIHTLT